MERERLTLHGERIRLEPLGTEHIEGLVAAAAIDPALYQWSAVPQGRAAVQRYVETALEWRDAGTAVPFAIVDARRGTALGSTRYFNLERWDWPEGQPRHRRAEPDACEIGYTWLTRAAIRTSVNTEAKLLLLTHAFESWQVLRVCLHTDVRNQRSRAAMERMGAKFEGILRAHRMAVDFTPRDSARYSIVAAEWPAVQHHLRDLRAGYA